MRWKDINQQLNNWKNFHVLGLEVLKSNKINYVTTNMSMQFQLEFQ